MLADDGPTLQRSLLVTVLVAALCLATLPPVVVAELEDPRFETTVPEPVVQPGTTQELTIQLVNDAREVDDRVKAARNVEVEVRSGKTPITIESGTQLLGRMEDGAPSTVSVRMTVPEDIPAGSYSLPVDIYYEFGSDEKKTKTVEATVRVEPRARFVVVESTASVAPGEQGTVSVTVENEGSRVARDARLVLTSMNADLAFGESTQASRHLGTLEPGERRTVSYTVTASPDAEQQPYAFEVSATYEDHQGVTKTARPGTIGVTPLPELSFDVADVSSDLRVGEEGTLAGSVVNRGDRTAHDAVVVVSSSSPQVRVPEVRYPVGDLASGQSADFDFSVVPSRTADPGPRLFTVTVEYETADGDARQSDPIQLRRQVEDERDWFDLQTVNASFGIDTSNRFVVRITNTGDEPLTEVNAMLTAQPPFTSESPESYVDQLDPGETATLAFELTVSEDAVASTHAVPVNVTAEDADGDTIRTGPHLVSVTVAEPTGAGGDVVTLAIGAVVVLVILGVGYWWLRQ